jgi:hypothetical protein
MAMNRKVFLSILAMDSYQRGYAPGIEGLLQLTPGSTVKIGNATLTTDSEAKLGPSAQATGFYASAYQWGSETIISYRGTDFDVGQGEFVTSQFARDLSRGWSTFLAPTLGAQTQFGQARAFFRAVVPGSDFNDGRTYNNVIVTGHSLGGALAGYVDARADVKSFLVDPIPYGVNDNTAQQAAA